jgi:tetratricopeptide (TPR) repeat protein
MSSVAVAHDGPEHEIDELTERIKVEGESADLLLQRAIEYNVIRKGNEAVKDLERALDYDAHSPAILRELSRAYFSIAKTNEALDTATRGIKAAEEPDVRAGLLMVRSEIQRAKREYQKALDDAERAIKEHPDNAEWYLARSQLQQQLGLKKERIKGLEEGIKETGSGLLEAEHIDALIDGGKGETALAKIDAELKDARVRSTWLIRRAKVRFALKQDADAKADAKAAITELNERLSHGASDPLLLADRGQAFELLGNRDEAKKDYESARNKGVTDEWVREKIHALGGDDRRGGGRNRRGDAKPIEDADKKEGDKPDDKAQ